MFKHVIALGWIHFCKYLRANTFCKLSQSYWYLPGAINVTICRQPPPPPTTTTKHICIHFLVLSAQTLFFSHRKHLFKFCIIIFHYIFIIIIINCPDSFNSMCNCTVHYERVQFLVCVYMCVSVCIIFSSGKAFWKGQKKPPCLWSNKESSAIQRHYKLPQPPATSTEEFNLSPHTHSQVSYCDSIAERGRLCKTVHLILYV